MITSAQMARSAKEEIVGIKATIEEVNSKHLNGDLTPEDATRNIAYLQNSIEKLEQDIAEYESLKSGSTIYIKPERLEDLPRTITQLRLHHGWAQDRLADEIGVAQQQIARYESTDYEGISFQRLIALLDSFDAHISIEKIKLNINGKEQYKFKRPTGMTEEKMQATKKRGLFSFEKSTT